MNVVETLQTEFEQASARLAELDEQLKTERPGLVAKLSQLKRAIAALTRQPSAGPRKPMSPEAKERIRQGLERARAAKAAAKTGETPVQPQPAETDHIKKPVSSDKGLARAR